MPWGDDRGEGANVPDEARDGHTRAGTEPGEDPESTELEPSGLLSLEHALAGSGPAPEQSPARAARLDADRRIVEILRKDGFAGPRYEKATERWMDYGWRTTVKWTGTGEIFRRSRLAGRPVPADMITADWAQDDRYQIATDSVIGGLALFHKYGLVQGKWSPDGGASLSTYFVGATLRAFRPVYLRWFRFQQAGQSELARPDEDEARREIPDQRASDPCHLAAVNDEIKRILPYITDSQVREGLGWRAMGYTQAEAARRVGLTTKALERRISRIRTRLVASSAGRNELGEGGAR